MRLSNAGRVTDLSPALPQPFASLDRSNIRLREGQMSLVLAAPGVGKSLLAHNYALRCALPTLYFSADSDQYTVSLRTLSILSGHTLEQVEQNLHNSPSWPAWYDNQLGRADHIDWVFQPELDTEFIGLHTKAFVEKHGEYPQLTVVDNLANATEGGEEEYRELQHLCRELHRGARQTGSHMMVLHHVTGQYEDGDRPPPLSGALGKVGKFPEQVFGLYRKDYVHLGLVVSKNRGGRSGLELNLDIDYERATLR